MRKQKLQSGHGTCDKKILIPPSIRICHLFGELKKGDFLSPSPLYGPMSPSQQFFFWVASLNMVHEFGHIVFCTLIYDYKL